MHFGSVISYPSVVKWALVTFSLEFSPQPVEYLVSYVTNVLVVCLTLPFCQEVFNVKTRSSGIKVLKPLAKCHKNNGYRANLRHKYNAKVNKNNGVPFLAKILTIAKLLICNQKKNSWKMQDAVRAPIFRTAVFRGRLRTQ